jgi:hypothetical protein
LLTVGNGNYRKALDEATAVLDIGTEYRFRKELRPLEGWFKDKNYKAVGYRLRMDFGEYNCDLDLDACQIYLPRWFVRLRDLP